MYVCPSDTGTPNPICSYGYNRNCVGGPGWANPPIGLVVSQFSSPAKTVLFFEMTNTSTSAVYDVSKPPWTSGSDSVFTIVGNGVSPSGDGLGLGVSGGGEPFGYNEVYGLSVLDQYATGYLLTDGWPRAASNQAAFSSPLGRHSQGSNFVMADGHAKWLMPQNVCAGRQNSGVNYCATTNNAYAYGPTCAVVPFAATFAVF